MTNKSAAADRADALKEGWIRFTVGDKPSDLNLANIPLNEQGIFLKQFGHGPMWMLENGEELGMAAVWWLARRCSGEMYLMWDKAEEQWPGAGNVDLEVGGVGSLTSSDVGDGEAQAATPEE